MRIFSLTLRLTGLFVCVLLAACGGGGGGGGDSKVATSITVIDGYIKGATVCVDSNDNGACDATETQGTTDENGKVTLNIPAADVGKYHIVAYVPTTAIDSDTGKAVGTAFTLKAPKDESSVVTPFTTLVVQTIQANSTWTTEQAKNQVASDTGVELSVLTSDFTKATDQTPRTLARTFVALQKNRLTALNALSACKASSNEKEKLVLSEISKVLALKSNKDTISGITACSTAVAQKLPACQSAIDSAATTIVNANTSLSTASLQDRLSDVSCHTQPTQLATISGATSGGKDINSGDRTDSLAITLTGIYTGAALGTDYSVHVLDGNNDVGMATKNDTDKTWSLILSSVTPGKHDYKAVVVRNSDSLQGTASSAYTVNIGNSVSASSTSNVLDSITLTVRNLWSSVKSVVFSFASSSNELADGQQSTQTINAPQNNGVWQTITTAFKTTGSKVINLVFKDAANGTGNTLDSSSISVTVGQGSVSQTASISSVKDHATPTAAEIADNTVTKDTQPVISGTVTGTALGSYYDVAVYDNDTAIQGTLSYTNNKASWSFTPTAALSQGLHAFKAAVVRFDGVAGSKSSASNLTILSPALNVSPASPNVLDTVTFSASNLHSSITSVVWDLGDGNSAQTSTPTNGSSTVTTRYSAQGGKAVTVNYKNAQGSLLLTDTLTLSVAQGSVSQTASINSANDGASISSDGRTDSLDITLTGSYNVTLGTDYDVHVLDGSTDKGTATKNDTSKTWSLSLNSVTPGKHDYKAVVVRNSDSLQGKASSAFTINVGNSVSASNNNPGIGDEFTLSLSKLWSSVKSVVFTLAEYGEDIVDSVVSQVSELVNNAWQTVTSAFTNAGVKTITAEFKDSDGKLLDTRSITVTVADNPVSQSATITDVKDGEQSIAEGSSTSNPKPVITGSISPSLGIYFTVQVFDGASTLSLTGITTYSDDRKNWSFTPGKSLSQGHHELIAKVVRIDGVTETTNKVARTFYMSQYSLVSNNSGGNYDKTECVQDKHTGLIWEGKTVFGDRAGGNLYTNFNSTTIVQKADDTLSTQAEIDASTNSIGYVNSVNSQLLCGFNDWRLPTLVELRTLVKADSSPSIDPDWFPNTNMNGFYWSSASDLTLEDIDAGEEIRISDGNETPLFRFQRDHIRLVRSAP